MERGLCMVEESREREFLIQKKIFKLLEKKRLKGSNSKLELELEKLFKEVGIEYSREN